MLRRICAALLLSFFSVASLATTSTINPNIPASNSSLSSSPIRLNFSAAYSDINNIYNTAVFSSSPTFTGPVNGTTATWNGLDTAAAFRPTGSVVPTNGFYLPAANTPAIAALSSPVVKFLPTASQVDGFTMQGSATADVPHIQLGVFGSDSTIGMDFNTLGTTTSGGQFMGQGGQFSGTYDFFINSRKALELTDTYWNPNLFYAGPVNTNVVISSGWGDVGSDGLAVISAQSDDYCSNMTCDLTGAGLVFNALGPGGEIHFTSEGAMGHVTVDPPQGIAPGLQDAYNFPNSLRFAGSFGTSGQNPIIKIENTGDPADANIGLDFYNYANGGYNFLMGNGTSGAFNIKYKASAVNIVNAEGAAAGTNPILYASGPAGGIHLTLAGVDLGGVDIANGGQYNGTAGLGYIAKFTGGFEPSDYLHIAAGDAANSGPTLSPAANGGDTHAPLNLVGLGTDPVVLGGHIKSAAGGASAPAMGTCGTSPSVSGNDTRGVITTGTGGPTSCALNFGTTYGAAPVCVVSDDSATVFASITSISTTVLTIGLSGALTSGHIYYICIQ